MTRKSILTIGITSILLFGCYYDSEEYLYPKLSGGCDANNVTYTTCVKPIIDTNCKGCHSSSNASGGIALDSYTLMKTNYNLSMTAIHAGTMPKSGKLPQSDITTLENWSTQGFKE